MNLGDRIKSYEEVFDGRMPSRLPVIIRIDGKGFHTWTKQQHLGKPFDASLSDAMAQAMLSVAKQIEGCVFGFTQSDEITLVLKNDQSVESEPWFGNRVQKVCSIVASMITASFNRASNGMAKWQFPAHFDTRVFVVPSIQEAVNVLIWRQNDAVKNSISAACYYEVGKVKGKGTARKLMHGLNQNQQQELLFKETSINWNDYPTKYKRGIGCYRVTEIFTTTNPNAETSSYERSVMKIDEELPIFTQQQELIYSILEKGKLIKG